MQSNARLVVLMGLALVLVLGDTALGEATSSDVDKTCTPRAGRNACESCHEENCCSERRACERDAACTGYLTCLREGCSSPPCHAGCGAAPASYLERFACQMAQCNSEVCGGPVAPCLLCTYTACVESAVACQTTGCPAYEMCLEACRGGRVVAACEATCVERHPGAAEALERQSHCLAARCAESCP